METEVCVRCHQEKPLSEFRGNKTKCIDCGNELRREAWQNRTDEQRKRDAERMKRHQRTPQERRIYYLKREKIKLQATSCKIYVNTCIITGELFVAKQRDAKYSVEGAKLLARIKAKNIKRVKRLGYSKPTVKCRYCSKEFEYGLNGNYTYCSSICRNRMKNAKTAHTKLYKQRKALSKSKVIIPINVFKRDKYTCQMCGVKTPIKLRGTYHNNAPELDHIIPLSKGGTHTYMNVQCLCRKCNGKKGNKMIGQLKIAL